MKPNLEDRYALVTGASTGIGRAIAIRLAENGTHVGLVARNEQGLSETSNIIKGKGGKSTTLITDLRSDDDLMALTQRVSQDWGRLDYLVHVAGVWHDKERAYAGVPLHDIPITELDEVFEVGLRAPIMLTRSLIPLMIKAQRGKILFISGTFASGGAGWLHYYVSKLALEHFTVGIAQELRPYGIQANCISPSDVATQALKNFFPDDAKTALTPETVADFAEFFLSEKSEHITGQITVIKNKAAK
jgi:3-oxoacyl-[acyl-carrier protein] reductase